jgi:hypothetical protein
MAFSIKSSLNKKWWSRSIRGYNWFSFRYWWFNFLLWILLIALLLWLLCRISHKEPQCDREAEINSTLNSINMQLENCCDCDLVFPSLDSTSSEIDRLRDSLNGKVGELTVTLAWKTEDDLDLMLIEPDGFKIFFSDTISPNNGVLDVDKNKEGTVLSVNAIENIFYERNPPVGKYQVYVINYKKNSSISKIPAMLQIKTGRYTKEIPFNIENNSIKRYNSVYTFNLPFSE